MPSPLRVLALPPLDEIERQRLRAGRRPGVGGLPLVRAHREVGDLRQRIQPRRLFALEEAIEEAVHDFVVVEPRVAHAPLADDRVGRGAGVRAVRDRRDDRPLLVGDGRRRRLPHVVVEREVRPDRHVVPRHEPEAGHVQLLVVVIEAAAVPRRIVRRALDHLAAGFDRHRRLEDAARTVHVLDDVLRRQMPERLRPVDRRRVLREVERLRRADQILLRGVGRKHRPHLVLLAVEPRDEEHLHRAAAVPVALFVVGTDAADAGAEALHVHRRVAGMTERGHAHLILGGRRTAGRADLAVRPGLLRQPVDRVESVGLRSEDVVVAFREEVAALVLHDVGVAALDGGQLRAHVGRHAVLDVPEVEVVGRSHPDDRNLAGRVLRAIDVGRQAHAVRHRHHHLALHDRDRLELGFHLDAALLVGRVQRPLLRERGGAGHCDNGRHGELAKDGLLHRQMIRLTNAIAVPLR